MKNITQNNLQDFSDRKLNSVVLSFPTGRKRLSQTGVLGYFLLPKNFMLCLQRGNQIVINIVLQFVKHRGLSTTKTMVVILIVEP